MTPSGDTKRLLREAVEAAKQDAGRAVRLANGNLGELDWRPSRAHVESMRNALQRIAEDLTAALEAEGGGGWRPIETAPKDGTRVLALLRDDLPDHCERFRGVPFVARHPGLGDDGYDCGWNFGAPVGHGGFPDAWFVGWMPLPAAPTQGEPGT